MARRKSLDRELRAIRRSTRLIATAFEQLHTRLKRAERQAARAGRATIRKARKLRISPKRRAQLKLQGAYMGFMRQLKPAQKARVKTVKEKKGFEAAIRIAKELIIR